MAELLTILPQPSWVYAETWSPLSHGASVPGAEFWLQLPGPWCWSWSRGRRISCVVAALEEQRHILMRGATHHAPLLNSFWINGPPQVIISTQTQRKYGPKNCRKKNGNSAKHNKNTSVGDQNPKLWHVLVVLIFKAAACGVIDLIFRFSIVKVYTDSARTGTSHVLLFCPSNFEEQLGTTLV